MSKAELYFSCDIEADGPIPGPYSMVSIGMSICGVSTEDGDKNTIFKFIDPGTQQTFYDIIQPISEQWDEKTLAVSGLSREFLENDGAHPMDVMNRLGAWVRKQAANYSAKPIFVAYPLSFDWMFSHWYFENFSAKGDPFHFSNAVDMKTMYMTQSKKFLTRSTKRQMPEAIKPNRRHTHHALDDALGQGELFQNLMARTLAA